jgi:hypothetical protein
MRAGPAARILDSSPDATNGANCATRRAAWVTGFDCGAAPPCGAARRSPVHSRTRPARSGSRPRRIPARQPVGAGVDRLDLLGLDVGHLGDLFGRRVAAERRDQAALGAAREHRTRPVPRTANPGCGSSSRWTPPAAARVLASATVPAGAVVIWIDGAGDSDQETVALGGEQPLFASGSRRSRWPDRWAASRTRSRERRTRPCPRGTRPGRSRRGVPQQWRASLGICVLLCMTVFLRSECRFPRARQGAQPGLWRVRARGRTAQSRKICESGGGPARTRKPRRPGSTEASARPARG